MYSSRNEFAGPVAFPGFATPFTELPFQEMCGGFNGRSLGGDLFEGLFGNAFPFVQDNTENVVKVIELYDLEDQDVEVNLENGMVEIKGEYSKDIDATRIYHKFEIPEGKLVKSATFLKDPSGNKLVILFTDNEGTRD